MSYYQQKQNVYLICIFLCFGTSAEAWDSLMQSIFHQIQRSRPPPKALQGNASVSQAQQLSHMCAEQNVADTECQAGVENSGPRMLPN